MITVKELITLLQRCDSNRVVKIFNIQSNMDILSIDSNPTIWDPIEYEDKLINEVWITIGFMNESKDGVTFHD